MVNSKGLTLMIDLETYWSVQVFSCLYCIPVYSIDQPVSVEGVLNEWWSSKVGHGEHLDAPFYGDQMPFTLTLGCLSSPARLDRRLGLRVVLYLVSQNKTKDDHLFCHHHNHQMASRWLAKVGRTAQYIKQEAAKSTVPTPLPFPPTPTPSLPLHPALSLSLSLYLYLYSTADGPTK